MVREQLKIPAQDLGYKLVFLYKIIADDDEKE